MRLGTQYQDVTIFDPVKTHSLYVKQKKEQL